MKGIVSVLAVLTLAGVAFAQPPQVYTPPAADPSVPTFVNAEVVRVDPSARTITFRSESRDTVLTVEGEALTGLSRLHAGDQVMLGYRVDTLGGRATRIVTNIRTVTPAASAPSRATTIESVRVVAANPSKRTLTITDATGAKQVLSVARGAAGSLRRLRAGDDVVLSYSSKGRARTVTRIEPPNTPGAPAILQPVPNVAAPVPTLNVALPPATAGMAPEGASAAEAEAIRAQGTRDFQAAAGVLTLKANEIDGFWFGYKDVCLNGTTPSGAATSTGREWFILLGPGVRQPTDDACRQRLADLTRAAQQFQQQLDIARDAARKADVLPGTMREILQRNRLDR